MGVDKQGRGSQPADCVMATNPPSSESDVFRHFYSEVEAVLDPAAVARLLWQGGVLTDAQLDEAELTSTSLAQRKSDIMSAVRKVIRGDSRKIWVLVAALEKFPASCLIARRMREELNNGINVRIFMTIICCRFTCTIQPEYNRLLIQLLLHLQRLQVLWVAVADPYVGLARKCPKTKWRLQWAENELIAYIFAVQDICSILAT